MTTLQIVLGAFCLFLMLWTLSILVATFIESVANKKSKNVSAETFFFCLFSVGFYLSLVL